LKIKVAVSLLLLFAFASLLSSCRSSAPKGAAGGAPDFTVTDIQGQKISLSDYRGKVVLLDFWATWCAPCLQEIPHFIDMQQKLGPQGFQAIGLSMDDDLKPVQEFYQEHKLNYPVALGDSKIATSFGGILGLPVTFVINRDGQIRKKFVGATDPAQIEQEVVAALKQPQ
jgi:cytochrome c biogenesis protein CcmG/thiol:disulfide interchange protein DsbE